jgi:hypothetical protein
MSHSDDYITTVDVGRPAENTRVRLHSGIEAERLTCFIKATACNPFGPDSYNQLWLVYRFRSRIQQHHSGGRRTCTRWIPIVVQIGRMLQISLSSVEATQEHLLRTIYWRRANSQEGSRLSPSWKHEKPAREQQDEMVINHDQRQFSLQHL